MNTRKMVIQFLVAVAPVAALCFTSCTSKPPPDQGKSTATYRKGEPGGVYVETYQGRARITDINRDTRKVTVLTADGKKTVLKAGPHIVNFDQLRVGDDIKVTMTEQMVVAVAKPGTAPTDGSTSVVSLAAKGAAPGGFAAETSQVTATVIALDPANHKAKLQFPDGSQKTVAVRKDVDLSQRKVGEEVVIQITETLAVSVEKP